MKTIEISLELFVDIILDGYKDRTSLHQNIRKKYVVLNELFKHIKENLDPEEKICHIEFIKSLGETIAVIWDPKEWKVSNEQGERRKLDSDARVAEYNDNDSIYDKIAAMTGLDKKDPAVQKMGRKLVENKVKLRRAGADI